MLLCTSNQNKEGSISLQGRLQKRAGEKWVCQEQVLEHMLGGYPMVS